MESPPNITFGYLQMEERYKKLERTIKKLELNQLQKGDTSNQVFDSGSRPSSANDDILDNTIGEANSRVGSEVVSSSVNMRDILSQKLNTPTHGLTTSSVKNSPDVIDRVIMPPPKSIGILAHSSRRNSLASPQIIPKPTTSGVDSNTSVISAINYPAASDVDKKECKILHSTLDTSKPDRIFRQWKVGLSDTGELLIKGLIDGMGNKNCRSKPVVERINATTVKSFYSHIYSLQGRIYDENNELPEYVRGKFYNGFPDDWKNVHHVWQSFVTGGCSDNFRWPTPITDSDDDLISEVTEEYNPSKSVKHSRTRKILSRSDEVIKDSSKKSLVVSPVRQKLLSPRHSIKSGIPSNHNLQAPTQSPQKSSRSEPKFNNEEKKEVTDSGNESRLAVEVFGKLLLNDEDTEPSNEKLETLKAFSVLLKNKEFSVSFLENIVKMSNSLMNVITRTPDRAESNKFPVTENVDSSKSHSNAGVNKNSSAISNKGFKQQSHEVSSKYSPKNNLTYVPVRRKLVNGDYSSSDEFDSNYDKRYDSRRALKRNLLRVPCKNSYELERINRSRRRRSPDSDNSDSDDFRHKNKKSLVSPSYDDRRKNRNVIDPEQQKFSRSEMRKPIQSRYTARNSRIPLPKSSYPRDRGGAESVSTITGFLANYDSCISITEDERASRDVDREKMHVKRNNDYDSCISITEDESSKIKKVIAENNIKKPVLQETNSQYLDQLMKRTTIQRLGQLNNYQQPQQRPKTHLSSETAKEFSPAVSSKATMTDDKENKEVDNRHPSRPASSKIIKREERQETVNISAGVIPKIIKPSVVRVENVALHLKPKQKESLSLKVKSPKKIIDKQLTDNNSIEKSSRPLEDKIKVSNPEALTSDIIDRDKNTDTDKYSRAKRNVKVLEIQSEEAFGSVKNPKVLTCWIPNIKKLGEKKYGLVFEGKLLNEAGHVSTKKHTTDLIIRRVTPRLVETEKNEFYELYGDIVNTKHIVPQELLKLCLDGCPSKIKWFCDKWANIKNDNLSVSKHSLDGSIDIASAPTSSRGRRRVQTLRYWEGERLSTKGDEVYYSPGHFQESIISSHETSRKDTSCSSPRKRNGSYLNDKEKKSNHSVEQDELVKAKQIKDNNNYKLNTQNSVKKAETSPMPENGRRSQRFRNLQKKSYLEVQSKSSDCSDIDDKKLRTKRRRSVVNSSERRPEDSRKKLRPEKKLRHDSSLSDSDITPEGVSYKVRKVHDKKFFSDE